MLVCGAVDADTLPVETRAVFTHELRMKAPALTKLRQLFASLLRLDGDGYYYGNNNHDDETRTAVEDGGRGKEGHSAAAAGASSADSDNVSTQLSTHMRPVTAPSAEREASLSSERFDLPAAMKLLGSCSVGEIAAIAGFVAAQRANASQTVNAAAVTTKGTRRRRFVPRVEYVEQAMAVVPTGPSSMVDQPKIPNVRWADIGGALVCPAFCLSIFLSLACRW